jgi:DNA modification methylase
MSCLPKGESVTLVPFVGSGSECVAAKELNSSYIGFELNPDYIRIAKKILNTKTHQDKLLV